MTKHESFADNINLERSIGLRQEDDIDVENERRTVDELSDLVVLNDEKGGRLRLGDIATINDGTLLDYGYADAVPQVLAVPRKDWDFGDL